jgi:hypothetical protein
LRITSSSVSPRATKSQSIPASRHDSILAMTLLLRLFLAELLYACDRPSANEILLLFALLNMEPYSTSAVSVLGVSATPTS